VLVLLVPGAGAIESNQHVVTPVISAQNLIG